MEESTSVQGGCLCGAIRYEAKVFPTCAYYCHCGICKKVTGQPAEIGVPVKVGSLRFRSGGPKFYQSSDFMKRGFCAECGSRVINMTLSEDDAWATNVAVCSLDSPDDVAPFVHLFSENKLAWYDPSPEIPNAEEQDVDAVIETLQERVGVTSTDQDAHDPS